MKLKKGSKAALVCCSNGLPCTAGEKMKRLEDALASVGLEPVAGEYLYAREGVFSASGRERAESLMGFFRDKAIRVIFDVSGGDIANELLPYLDYPAIAASGKQFWGYSDLTTVINAIYAKTGRESVLYQIRNLIGEDGERQISRFTASVFRDSDELYSFGWRFIQGKRLAGTVVGGNIRCLLKLAGTEYWPDMRGKVLLLEALGGTAPQMTAYLNQLQQMGVFRQISGILLGTFTRMQEEGGSPDITALVGRYAGTELPVAKTEEIGHGSDARAIVIGRSICLE